MESPPSKGPRNKMSPRNDPNAAARRDHARARLSNLTRVALLATTGATVGLGILVAKEHPGSSGATSANSGQSSGGTNATTPSSSSSSTGNSGSSSSGNTGNNGSSVAPSTSSQTPTVTSGGTSR